MENISEKDRINAEILFDLLEDSGFKLDINKIKDIYNVYIKFMSHLDAFKEYESTPFFGIQKGNTCPKCEIKEKEIESLKRSIDTFKESVKQRTGATNVWIDGNTVMYNYR